MMGAMLSLAMAGAAVAEPFQSFVDLCVSTDADGRAAEVAVKGAGWSDMAEALPPEITEMFRDPALYLNVDPANPGAMVSDDPIELLVTGWGRGEEIMDFKGIVMDICGVMSPQADPLMMSKRLTEHLGVPSSTSEGETMWLYSRQGDRFVSEAGLADAEDDAVRQAAQTRSLFVAYVFEEDGLAGLFVGAMRPEAKAPDR